MNVASVSHDLHFCSADKNPLSLDKSRMLPPAADCFRQISPRGTKFSASKIEIPSEYSFRLPGTEKTFYLKNEVLLNGSIKTHYKAFTEDGEIVHVSRFRSYARPDGEPPREGWAQLYSLDKVTYDRLRVLPFSVPLIDRLEFPTPEGIEQFVVSQHCEKSLLNVWENSKGPLSEYAKQLLDIFRIAHQEKLIFNDFKLDNCLIDGHGDIKIIDFDLVYFFGQNTPKQQKSLGTPNYLPPESFCLNIELNPFQKDLWALGIALACLLDKTPNKKASKHLLKVLATLNAPEIFEKQPPTSGTLGYSISLNRSAKISDLSYYIDDFRGHLEKFYTDSKNQLSPVVRRLMNLNPKYRYHSIEEVILDFEKYHAHEDISINSDTMSTSSSVSTSSDDDASLSSDDETLSNSDD